MDGDQEPSSSCLSYIKKANIPRIPEAATEAIVCSSHNFT